MIIGDIVRFRFPTENTPHKPKRHMGLLVKYSRWEKIAFVLYEGKILRLSAKNVEKAGAKDFRISSIKTKD